MFMLRELDFLILGFLKQNDIKHTTLGQFVRLVFQYRRAPNDFFL